MTNYTNKRSKAKHKGRPACSRVSTDSKASAQPLVGVGLTSSDGPQADLGTPGLRGIWVMVGDVILCRVCFQRIGVFCGLGGGFSFVLFVMSLGR